jgi:glucan biosynthesis protein C
MTSTATSNRRHDIDALRALAFALVIVYHVGMYYVAEWDWHLKSPHATTWLQVPMRLLNLWRMDLVFLVSGIALALLARSGRRWTLLGQRSRRLLLPLAFGMLVIVPYQPYAQGVAKGLVEPGFGAFLLRYFSGGPWPANAFDGWQSSMTWNHLWYLPYLWLYTTVILVLLPVLRGAVGDRLQHGFTGLRGAWLLVLPALPLLLWSATLRPFFPPTHDLLHDPWLHAVSFTMVLYGFWIGVDRGLWAELARLRRHATVVALALMALYVAGWKVDWEVPAFPMRAIANGAIWTAICAILGWAHVLLNRPWPWLGWANESVYPWYMLHQTLIVVLAVWLAPLALGPVVEPVLLLAGTVLGCWGITALVRRSNALRPLFGLKRLPAAGAVPAGARA